MKELASFMLKWASAEAQYAKSMSDISKNVNKKAWRKVLDKETGTFLNCFSVFNDEIEKIAKKHDEVSSKLAREIIPQMETLIKEGEKNVKKKLSSRASDLAKEYSETLKKLKKAKEDYFKACKDADQAREQYETKTKEGQVKPQIISKLKSQMSKKQAAAEAAHVSYKKTLEVMNQAQVKFYTKDMPGLLDQFQSYDEERTQFLRKVFGEAMETLNTLPDFYAPLLQSMQASVDAINDAEDVAAFVEQNKSTCVTVPEDIPYEPYVSDLPPGFGDSDLGSSGTSLGGSGMSPMGGGMAGSSGGGLSSTTSQSNLAPGEIGVYKERPTIDPLKEFPGLTDADAALSVDAKAEKLRAQITAIQTEVGLQEKSKKGVESLFPLYQNDKVQLDSLKQGFEDVQRQIARLVDRQTYLEGLLQGLGASSWKEPSGATATSATDAAAAGEEEEEVEITYARALFDYNAAQETELSFRQGDVLIIIDQDSSGWWYAELEGKAGFAPKNYLKEISAEEAESSGLTI